MNTAWVRPQPRDTQPQEYNTRGIQFPREKTGKGQKCSLDRTSFLLWEQAGGGNKHDDDSVTPSLNGSSKRSKKQVLIKRRLHVFVSHKGVQVCTRTHRDYTFMHNSALKLIQGTNGTVLSA